MTSATIRAATVDDIPDMQAVEIAAGRQFRDVGMDSIADAEPFDDDELGAYVADGRAWCAELDGAVVGYAVAEEVDGIGHLEQLSVPPDVPGKGIGRALVDRAQAWAARPMTLTTFRDVPWNAPLYARLGFEVIEGDDQGTGELHGGYDARGPRSVP